MRLFPVTLCALFAFAFSTAVSAPVSSASIAPADVCSAPQPSTQFADPPSVVMRMLPPNASGQHELILSVHRNRSGVMCYRYKSDGTVNTVAPLIRVQPGETFALRLVNDLASQSAGEYVASTALPKCMPMPMQQAYAEVHPGYLNHPVIDRIAVKMRADTNVHFHGFQGSADQENIFLSTLSTPMHACEYVIRIPETQPPGTYFYHSHAHMLSGLQVFSGLDGIWVVDPKNARSIQPAEHFLILRDALPEVDDNLFAPGDEGFRTGALHEEAIVKTAPVAYDPFNPPAWPSALALRDGNNAFRWTGCNSVFNDALASVNGSSAPQTLTVPAGAPLLLRTLNGTADSFKTLALRDETGQRLPLKVMAFDGAPVGAAYAQYISLPQVLLGPSGRTDVLVRPALGKDIILYSAHDCSARGPFNSYALRHDLVVIHPVPSSREASAFVAMPAVISTTPAARLLAYARGHSQTVRRRALTYTEYAFAARNGGKPHVSMYITDTTDTAFREHQFWPAYATGASVPVHADIVVKQGTIEEWTLFNATAEAHTFHIHQMTFVAENQPGGVPLTLDNVIVPFGKLRPNKNDPYFPLVQPSATRILLDFRHVPRGTFVFHCHILPHEDEGMMGVIRVV